MSASANDDGARRGEDDHSHGGVDESGEKGEKHAASADSSAPKRATLEGLASGATLLGVSQENRGDIVVPHNDLEHIKVHKSDQNRRTDLGRLEL